MATAANIIQTFLDAAEFPWRATRAELAAKFGFAKCHFSDWDYVAVPMQSALSPHLIRPLYYWEFGRQDEDIPQLSYQGDFWVSDDARANLAAAYEILAASLGKPILCDTSNTLGWQWQSGPSCVKIICFPPDLNVEYRSEFGPNSFHQREPRLETACSISVETGFRYGCTVQEQDWIAQFSAALELPVIPLADYAGYVPQAPGFLPRIARTIFRDGTRKPASLLDAVAARRISQTELAYARQPIPDALRLHGMAGLSADGSHLIWVAGQLMIVPLADIKSVELTRIARARGADHALLQLICQRSPTTPEIPCWFLNGDREHSLDEVAPHLAALLDRPLKITQGYND
jgi:hypothetical protein